MQLKKLTIDEIKSNPIAFSVSDDDLCASCQQCNYVPGNLSLCQVELKSSDSSFPGKKDKDNYVIKCEQHLEIPNGKSNWVGL